LEHQQQNDLLTDFRTHEAVCEERWKTIFNEVKKASEDSRVRNKETKQSIDKLHKLVWTVGGALILFLAGLLASGNIL
tara:strand:+ start:1713 stop:1946 length:234 start_codon:yes stop_codon:yes gene_type:complete